MFGELVRKIQKLENDLQRFITQTVQKATEVASEVRRLQSFSESLGRTVSEQSEAITALRTQVPNPEIFRESVENQRHWNEEAVGRLNAQVLWNGKVEQQLCCVIDKINSFDAFIASFATGRSSQERNHPHAQE